MDREDPTQHGDEASTQQSAQVADALRAIRSTAEEAPTTETDETTKPTQTAWSQSPWGFLGEPTSDTQPTSSLPEVPAPTPGTSNEKLSEAEREKLEKEARMQAYVEHKEAITTSGLQVRLDTQAIARLVDTVPVEEMVEQSYLRKDEVEDLIADRRADISRTIEAIARLPEILEFKPGITLIVGENGLGKSTLAKSLRYAALTHDRAMQDGDSIAEARNWVLSPRAHGDAQFELNDSGLAPEISEYIHVDYYGHMPYITPHYYDAAEIIGRQKTLNREAGRTDYRYDEHGQSMQYAGTHSRTGRSHRQTVDDQLFGYLKSEKESEIKRKSYRSAREDGKKYPTDLDTTGPQVYFIDEPETGMSPRRHKQLANEILDVTHEGATIILPTNSTVLYDSDLPRIDLEHPERGIFRPSEYPEDLN
ncbi:AAA family ATPase [bacterium]|nr:MAG: AAA family ATPase [bacterium]